MTVALSLRERTAESESGVFHNSAIVSRSEMVTFTGFAGFEVCRVGRGTCVPRSHLERATA